MSEKPRNEKGEKDQGESWDEKWRRDPIEAAMWALILIWAGAVWLLSNLGVWDGLLGGDMQDAWPIVFLGAGLIVLLAVAFRLVVPAYRRPIVGSLIFGVILLGIGLGGITEGWLWIGPLILIAIGVGAFLTFFFRR